MIAAARIGALTFLFLLASASAGASRTRPPMALTASPEHVSLAGNGRATIRVTNTGAERVVVDVSRAGFSLDLQGRPRIVGSRAVARSAADWIRLRPRSLTLKPGGVGSVAVASTVPRPAEPGDHDALLLLTTRRRSENGVAVRMRMGVVVVVRAPGVVVHQLRLGGLRVARVRGARFLDLAVANRGNVTESVLRSDATASLFAGSRRVAKVSAEPRTFRPRTHGVLEFRLPRKLARRAVVRVEVDTGSARAVIRTYRLRF